MIKIAFFYNSITPNSLGGVQRFVLDIATSLHVRNIAEPVLITSEKGAFSKEFHLIGLKVFVVPMTYRDAFRPSERLLNLIANHKIEIIQSEGFFESLVAGQLRASRDILKHVFRVHTLFDGADISILKKKVYTYLNRNNSNNIDMFVPISKNMETELLKSKIKNKKIKVINNGIDSIGEPDKKNAYQKNFNRAVAIIGALQFRKQQDKAVEVIGHLKNRGINIELHLIGEDINDFSLKIKEKIKSNNVEELVHIHGRQSKENIYKIIKNIPVILLPSLFEGVPTSLIEAMSLGKIAVGSNVNGIPELIEDGVNGMLFMPHDFNKLADILVDIFTSNTEKWQQMRSNAYQTWQNNYTKEKMIADLADLYCKLIK